MKIVAVVFVLIVIAGVLVMRARGRASPIGEALIGDPAATLLVRGWTRPELDRILSDFWKSYETTTPTQIAERPDGVLAVTFPSDIRADHLLFLVNYVRYPKDFDLKGRSIGVLAHVALTAAFGITDPALVGKQAVIYVPAGDTEYDQVYARTDAGAAYEISFTNMAFKPVPDARLPAEVAGL